MSNQFHWRSVPYLKLIQWEQNCCLYVRPFAFVSFLKHVRKESYKHKSAREKKVVKRSKTKKTFATITFTHIYNVAERRGENHLIDCYHFWQTSACVLLETMNSERHSNFFYTRKRNNLNLSWRPCHLLIAATSVSIIQLLFFNQS